MDWLTASNLGNLPAAGVVIVMGLLVITDKLVWHTRLRRVEAERDRWQGVALKALGIADQLTVHAEVASEVLTRLPDPAKDGEPI